jgi:hypothetical protein
MSASHLHSFSCVSALNYITTAVAIVPEQHPINGTSLHNRSDQKIIINCHSNTQYISHEPFRFCVLNLESTGKSLGRSEYVTKSTIYGRGLMLALLHFLYICFSTFPPFHMILYSVAN